MWQVASFLATVDANAAGLLQRCRLAELPPAAEAADTLLAELYDERDQLAAESLEANELPKELVAADEWLDQQTVLQPPKPDDGTLEQ